MQIIHIPINENNTPIALTIGNFDGVHIGHQAILNKVVSVAQQKSYRSVAMTFSPHVKVFFGSTENFLINSDEEKASYIAEQGIDTLLQIPFDTEFSQLSADDFIDMLVYRLQVKYLLVGDDFRFGYQGIGDFNLLEKACQKHHIELQRTPTISYQNERVSSSRVREAIGNNDFDLVEKLLGRRLSYAGKVIQGKQLGRTIKFPTANITLPKNRLLPSGVFAVKVRITDDLSDRLSDNLSVLEKPQTYNGMCNIGTKPTVSDENLRQIETHLFDFNQDLYGKTLHIEPIAKIRDEQKFNGIDELVAQLQKDKLCCLDLFSQ